MDEDIRFILKKIDEHQIWEAHQHNELRKDVELLRIEVIGFRNWRSYIGKRDNFIAASLGGAIVLVGKTIIHFL